MGRGCQGLAHVSTAGPHSYLKVKGGRRGKVPSRCGTQKSTEKPNVHPLKPTRPYQQERSPSGQSGTCPDRGARSQVKAGGRGSWDTFHGTPEQPGPLPTPSSSRLTPDRPQQVCHTSRDAEGPTKGWLLAALS